jgi:NTP pyrophosphatase (non-canonical NTP hydrolase)
MDLDNFQNKVTKWVKYNFSETYQDKYKPLLGIVEEVGELSHAHLKMEQGIRGTKCEHLDAKMDAIGDIMVYLADYCERNGLCLEDCVRTAWAEVERRDWIKFPQNGVSE